MKLEEMAMKLSEHCEKTKCANCQFEDHGRCLLYTETPGNWKLGKVNKRLREAVEGAARVLKEYCDANGESCEGCFFEENKYNCSLRQSFPDRWNIPEE